MSYIKLTLILTGIVLAFSACGDDSGNVSTEDHGTELSVDSTETAAEDSFEMVYANHILIPFQGCTQAPADAMTREEAFALLTSIADSINSGLITFEDAAAMHSSCPSAESGGFLGGFVRGQMVPEFEEVAFNLQPGSVSGVFETEYGYHIVLRQPTVSASHILIAYQGAERSTASRSQDEALELITALQDSVSSGQLSFEDAARNHSDCPSSQDGGDLGAFPRHVMTPSFEDAAFSLEVGDMSGIVETPFGYHLIMRTE